MMELRFHANYTAQDLSKLTLRQFVKQRKLLEQVYLANLKNEAISHGIKFK